MIFASNTTTDASYRDLYLSAPCGLMTTTIDGIITSVNHTFLTWTGLEGDSVIGTSLKDHLDVDSVLFFETRYSPALLLQGEVKEVLLTFLGADDTVLPAFINAIRRGDDVVTIAIFGATARHQYERDLMVARHEAQISESRVRVLQEATSAFAATTTEQDVCDSLYASATDAFSAQATGVFLLDGQGEFLLRAGSQPLDGLLVTQEPRASEAALAEGRTVTIFANDLTSEFPVVSKALEARNLHSVRVIPLLRGGIPLGVLACFFSQEQRFDDQFTALQTALARQAAQAIIRVRLTIELERLALHDQLTGLANRTLLQDKVTAAIANAKGSGRPLALLFLDLDGFKGINDQLGHAAGDRVLAQVSARIRTGVRSDDAVGRYGGDEFVAVCEDADLSAAESIADRICAAVREPLEGIPERLSVTASVGVAIYTPSTSEPPTNDGLLRLADDAMYLSKSAGKDRVSFLFA
ncbi:MAG: sensor domain-containing diguanylate cyclase [Rhodoglobus sp.]